ncbi:MAG: GntR family transcriptional regulator [Alphaproteobacteria bacterium]|nr:GntR family transcriptional regulator [Alphaproteobacteria bacterium]MBU0803925.1 GntR family transcriptional regulator [Alphaproteobacteria bacterium]MBU0872778.1 GntR family transcriptional regulator [Alphaproteobacteria bacterium]MBU1402852.1 GntR family transcriptional regulator [Alphaproteobacteria bacterium]MBU1593494.1 GntR family transcriptional regulator [Alphaproteobacteria bacterium]
MRRADGPEAGKRKSGALGRDISADLETQIVEGRLSPGAKLDEVALGNHYSVSRTPVREALRALAAKGLVEFQPRIGAIVARPTVGEVMDLFEVVAEMEGVAARLACERMEADDKARIVEAYEACQKAASAFDPEEYFSTNGDFHSSIQQASHNSMLIEQIEHLNKRLSPYRRFITFRPGRTQTAMKEHEAVFEALLRGDGETASTSMRSHVRVLAEDSLALSKSLRF